ncbi:MAG: hypothetical protein ACK5Q5_03980 [Planctomycetaceae bacterium]
MIQTFKPREAERIIDDRVRYQLRQDSIASADGSLWTGVFPFSFRNRQVLPSLAIHSRRPQPTKGMGRRGPLPA